LSLSKTDQSATDSDDGLPTGVLPISLVEAIGRGARLGHILLSRVKCDRFHRDGAMLPKILRSIGIYT
jgi:hypothetical protein